MNIDEFGAIIDKLLKENEVGMQIILPEGSLEAEIEDNVNLGSVIRFYIFLHALKPIFRQMLIELGDVVDREGLVGGLLDMMRGELLEDWRKENEI